MAEHVRVYREGELRGRSRTRDEFTNVARRHRSATFGNKQIRAIRPFTPQLAKGTKFGTSKGMSGWDTFLKTLNGEKACLQVKLLPTQADCFTDTKSMPVHDQEESAISVAVAAGGSGSQQRFDLGGSEILAGSRFAVASTEWGRHFPIYGVSGSVAALR
jgi:hypothetical protein